MKTILLFSIVFFIGLTACKKDQITNPSDTVFVDTVSATRYYESDIIPSQFAEIYNSWRLIRITGGYTGNGYIPDFDYITFKKNGIYCITRGDTLKEFGKISIEKHDADLVLKFIPEKMGGNYFSYVEKTVDLSHKDTLYLIDPCCDLYNYEFIKEK
jgi:hypothetical protein